MKPTAAQCRVLQDIARRGPLQRWRLYTAGHRYDTVERCVERGWLRQVTIRGVESALDLTENGRAALERG